MGVWGWLWVSWIGLFLVLEGIALARRKYGDTLSEQVWNWFGIGKKDPQTGELIRPASSWHVQSRRVALLAFLIWLTVHFMTGGYL
jgi:hypothetical protein